MVVVVAKHEVLGWFLFSKRQLKYLALASTQKVMKFHIPYPSAQSPKRSVSPPTILTFSGVTPCVG